MIFAASIAIKICTKQNSFDPLRILSLKFLFNGIVRPLEKVFHINECTKGLFLSFKRRCDHPNAVTYSKLPIHVKT